MGSGPVAPGGDVAYSYTNTGLVATSLASGTQRWSVQLPGASDLVSGAPNQNQYMVAPLTPGVVADATGGSLIVATYPVTIAGGGTERDTAQVQVVAVDPAGHILWKQAIAASGQTPRVVGGLRDSRGAAAVIDGGNVTAVLDAGSGAAWWSVPNVEPMAVNGDVVVGMQSTDYSGDWSRVGIRGSDGTQKWNVDSGGTIVITRPPTVVATGADRAIITNTGLETTLIDTTTGGKVATLKDPDPALLNADFSDCRFDDRATVVCWGGGGEGDPPSAIGGFDSHSGQPLWNVTDQNSDRTTVTVTCVYNGVIYGDAQHGSVELDARTGKDLVDDPGLDPTQVVPGWGLYTDLTSRTHSTTAHRATD